MSSFDWDGNGEHDAFDDLMDMEAMSNCLDDNDEDSDEDLSDFETEDLDDSFSDFETEDLDEDLSDFETEDSDESMSDFENYDTKGGAVYDTDTTKTALTEKSGKVSQTQQKSGKKSGNMSFQNELRKNMRSPEAVNRANEARERSERKKEAKKTLEKIKSILLQDAKDANYTTENGVTKLSCLCYLDFKFLSMSKESNSQEIWRDQQKFVLFRDPNLVYKSWIIFNIDPKYSHEYEQYTYELKRIAAGQNISLEFVVHNARTNKEYPFPTKAPGSSFYDWNLCVRASTVISSGDADNAQPETLEAPQTIQEKAPLKQETEQSDKQKAKQSIGAVIGKSLLVIVLIGETFALCLSGGMGYFSMGLVLIGLAIAGYYYIMGK